MKIKTTKKLNLPELIQYVWEKDDVLGEFTSNCGTTLYTSNLGSIRIEHAHKYIGKEELFTIEVEEVITPTTRFDELTEYIYDSNDNHHFTAEHKGANISLIIDCETHQFKSQAIYCKDTLIWSKEHGIPEDGTLEVESE